MIISQYETGKFTQKQLGAAFDLSLPTINKILHPTVPSYAQHGMSSTAEYDLWIKLRKRANLFPAWKNSFSAFIRDVGQRPTSDWTLRRLNPGEPYQPGNVEWFRRLPAKRPAQPSQERVRQLPKNLTHAGRTMSVTEWAKETGLGFARLRGRLRTGWGIAKALTTPPMANRKARSQ